MDEQVETVLHADGPEGTARVAAALAPHLRAGDAVLLTGELAAGKTTFVSALVAALGSQAAVSSPTFSLAQFYATPGPRVLHVDTYRLDDLTEFRDLGLDEYLDEVIALVEWGDLVAGEFVDPLRMHLAADPDDAAARRITVRGSARWAPALDALAAPAPSSTTP
ncbi:tRNA (adenosine(37)-N6)-threonylcarbamoyltransferase complex ATPase subunit type 1 TsaE [Actinomycetospora sp. TBRC 11914]|uniref:tRNA (adenosine(37)-N6)-threonylcarbamoyltransferase complex ATPase subunit type 1 TsaE n=1 Tax=Actinomycetospora sp. TBRC 11914 TaxID=2729387 RepID=UPI00145EC3F2|nr:tRNA (adenosine(37)-N6)-threonylcarbamoyltransferase complex ATPase subunit type 1 TsaE [Actinomycetospora sp. TBRC 11914]NMO91291.1 tRNA (adenosine(37)-N6)-threonylcarbamoyltransferase complex ATPase subunit type 1 TsaE [Actinomycetospora sp. TBRC 11914]